MPDEKRRFTRIPFNVRARVHISDSACDVDSLFNLSIGGCLVMLPVAVANNSGCQVDILLNPDDDDMIVSVKGEVVRTEDGHTAIKFIEIDPESLFHLQNIIRYNAGDAETVEKEIEKHPGIV